MARDLQAFLATKRFGCGAVPGEIAERLHDPVGSVLAELDRPADALLADARLPDRQGALALHRAHREARKARPADSPMVDEEAGEPERPGPNPARTIYRDEAHARCLRAVETGTPVLERLVAFWSNHLCVAANRGPLVRLFAGLFEREAIRPHVLGRFEDMLVAAIRHPAMLSYLDSTKSVGPRSRAGQRTGKALNENLAREILELHTLGVDGGYDQSDVTEFAKILTGWTFDRAGHGDGLGDFRFQAARREPGPATVLGRSYNGDGEGRGLAVLRDLAHHPSTARFLAMKLVRHFLGAPHAALADRLAAVYAGTDGDLAAMTRALVTDPEMWRAERPVFLAPYDHVVAALRASGVRPRPQEIIRVLDVFGQPLWTPPSPAGWPDAPDAWLAPDTLLERLNWAETVAARADLPDDIDAFAAGILGAAYDPDTRLVVQRAESREQAFAIMVMSPGFQRR
ncbi:DUF1800 domain-containing protein [Chthonobacter rhizosphaerae]|uniref:DUF1800 domain-containing protein n=1 Tax=Chthonobacter rhizosphaerae TaxID=2735553 RepID=UPI0015EE9E66|nr:DUF1800 domain-containing protein [Chthonobacter rhizosphaerae]